MHRLTPSPKELGFANSSFCLHTVVSYRVTVYGVYALPKTFTRGGLHVIVGDGQHINAYPFESDLQSVVYIS
jgi:hypothetical protein